MVEDFSPFKLISGTDITQKRAGNAFFLSNNTNFAPGEFTFGVDPDIAAGVGFVGAKNYAADKFKWALITDTGGLGVERFVIGDDVFGAGTVATTFNTSTGIVSVDNAATTVFQVDPKDANAGQAMVRITAGSLDKISQQVFATNSTGTEFLAQFQQHGTTGGGVRFNMTSALNAQPLFGGDHAGTGPLINLGGSGTGTFVVSNAGTVGINVDAGTGVAAWTIVNAGTGPAALGDNWSISKLGKPSFGQVSAPANVFGYIAEAVTEGTPVFNAGTQLAVQSNAAAGNTAAITIIAGSTGNATLDFGDNSSPDQGFVRYDNNTDTMVFGTNGVQVFGLGFNGGFTLNGGPVAFQPDATQTLVAANPIVASDGYALPVAGSAGAVILTSTPTIADGVDGQIILIIGTSDTNTLTIQSQNNLPGSNVRLNNGVNMVLGNGDTLMLAYYSVIGDWIQIGGRSDN